MTKDEIFNKIDDVYTDHDGGLIYLSDERTEHIKEIIQQAIDFIPCSTQLKENEETAFGLWLKNFDKSERDLYWYNKDRLYCIEAMKDIYNTEVKPQL